MHFKSGFDFPCAVGLKFMMFALDRRIPFETKAKRKTKAKEHAPKIIKFRQLFFCAFFMFCRERGHASRVAAFCARANADHMSTVSDRHVSFDS